MKHFSRVIMIVAVWAICVAPCALGQSLTTLTTRGIGPVTLGANAEELPYSVTGLYERKIHIDPRDNKDWFSGWEFYDQQDNVAIQAVTSETGKIVTIIVHSRNITTGEGLRVGMTQKQIQAVKGVQPTTDKLANNSNYPHAAYLVRGVNLWLDDKGVSEMYIGKQPQVSTRAKMYPDVPQELKEQAPLASTSLPKQSVTTAKSEAPKAANASKSNKVVLTDKGIYPVLLGGNVETLPASYQGVYAKKSKEELWDCDDFIGYYWQFYNAKGEEIFSASIDDDGIVIGITVTTSAIPMENGMHVGMTRRQVEAYKGVKKIVPDKWADYPRLYYEIGKFTLCMDWEDGKIVTEIDLETDHRVAG